MTTCIICRFNVQLDDVEIPTGGDRCVCLLCYTRETNTGRRLTRTLRGELAATIHAASIQASESSPA